MFKDQWLVHGHFCAFPGFSFTSAAAYSWSRMMGNGGLSGLSSIWVYHRSTLRTEAAKSADIVDTQRTYKGMFRQQYQMYLDVSDKYGYTAAINPCWCWRGRNIMATTSESLGSPRLTQRLQNLLKLPKKLSQILAT